MSSKVIQQLNDKLRTTFTGGRVLLTRGVRFRPVEDVREILYKVQHFSDFNEDNDPYKEHDFGKFAFKDDVIMWKIDYYAPDMQFGSEDPSDPTKTVRVLTIMTSEEY